MGAFLYYGLALLMVYLVHQLLTLAWWNPKKIEKKLNAQGITGPPYKFLIGNLKEMIKILGEPPSSRASLKSSTHPILQQALPHYYTWREQYGRTYMYWYGPTPRVVISEPEHIKEIMNNPILFPKLIPHPTFYQLMGQSIVVSASERWAARRKFFNPLFNMEALKELVPGAVRCAKDLVDLWINQMGASKELEIEAYAEFKRLTKDVIGRVICGEDYDEMQSVFHYQDELIYQVSEGLRGFYFPGMRFLPTRYNIKCWKLTRKIDRMFVDLVEKRFKEREGHKDMLESMMIENDKHRVLSKQDVIEECKTMFAAGFETTALLMAWATLLLGIHTDWQDKARQEVEQVLHGQLPTADSFNHLKIITMVINETLRIFAPALVTSRRVDEPIKVGKFDIPPGTLLDIPVLAIHHDPELWGEDVGEFNPARFADGVSKASKHPMALMPFGMGPRICIGMNLAWIEVRIALAMLLQNFTIAISPNYKHEPTRGLTVTPKHGAYVVLKKIEK